MDRCIHSYVIRSDFYGLYHIRHVTLDLGLIKSLVERWHLETHTFHLSVGEMVITLHDVAIILGLWIHGPPVTDTSDFDVSSPCHELLGVIPPPTELRGSTISRRWLSQQSLTLPIYTNEVIL